MSHPKPTAGITITIDVPAANANVPGNGSFNAYGYSSPTTGLTYKAKVVDGSNTYTGTAVAPVSHSPAYQWGFSFTGVPTGVEVALTVAGTDVNKNTGSETIEITCTNP